MKRMSKKSIWITVAAVCSVAIIIGGTVGGVLSSESSNDSNSNSNTLPEASSYKRNINFTNSNNTTLNTIETVWYNGAKKLEMTEYRRKQTYELNDSDLVTYDVIVSDEKTVNAIFGTGVYEVDSDKYIFATISKTQNKIKKISAEFGKYVVIEGASVTLNYGSATNSNYIADFKYRFWESKDPEGKISSNILTLEVSSFTFRDNKANPLKLKNSTYEKRSHAPDTLVFTPSPVSLTGTIPPKVDSNQ